MRDIMRIIMAVSGGALTLVGLLLSALWLIWPWLERPDPLTSNTLIAGGATLCLIFGITLFVQAFRGQDAQAPWPPAWILLFLWAGILILGAITLTSGAQDTLTVWLFPALHVLAIGLPVLALLSIGARRTDAPAGRMGVQFVFGGAVAFVISLAVQAGLLLALGALAVLLSRQIALGTLVQSLLTGNLAPLGKLRDAPILFAVVVVARVIIAPVVEEAAKALTFPRWSEWEPTRERALAWGLASGLGFALTAGMLLAVPGADTGAWWPSMLTQAGGALVHGMCTALVGLMWWRGYERGRRANVVLGYLMAVTIHAFWNVGGIARALVADTPLGTTTTQEPAFDVLIADVVGIIGTALLIALLIGLLLRLTARRQWVEEGAGD